ncbi:hypothetical protein J6V85_01525 [Candidatus Saccharibacteria bacterium]|nr:hypothetical protein [Candidatus Saccharibacteria bacterium]
MTSFRRVLYGLVGTIIMMIGVFLSQEPVLAFSVSPMKQTVSLVPGQTYSNRVITSLPLDAGKDMHYEVSVVPFKVNDKDNNYSIDLSGADERNEIVKWVSLSDGVNTVKSGDVLTGELAPGKKIDFIYTINVPESVMGGGQYFAVLVKSIPNSSDDGDENLIISETYSIASVVYAELPGEIKMDGALKENNINGFLLNPPITTSFVAENTGNTHFAVTYYLQVYPLFSDEEIYTNEEKPSMDYVLPETSRYISQTWDEAPSIGIFKVRQTAYYDFAEDKQSVTERIVIICPLWLLFIVIFAITMFVMWLIARLRARRKE